MSVFKINESYLILGSTEEKQIDEDNCYYISQDLEKLKYYLFNYSQFKMCKHIEKLNDYYIQSIKNIQRYVVVTVKGISEESSMQIMIFKLRDKALKFMTVFDCKHYSQAILEFHRAKSEIGLINQSKDQVTVYDCSRIDEFYLQNQKENQPSHSNPIAHIAKQYIMLDPQQINLKKKMNYLVQISMKKQSLSETCIRCQVARPGKYEFMRNYSQRRFPFISYINDKFYLVNASNKEACDNANINQYHIYDTTQSSSVFIPQTFFIAAPHLAIVKKSYQRSIKDNMFKKMMNVLLWNWWEHLVSDKDDDDYEFEDVMQNLNVQIYDQVALQKATDRDTQDQVYNLISLRYKIYL